MDGGLVTIADGTAWVDEMDGCLLGFLVGWLFGCGNLGGLHGGLVGILNNSCWKVGLMG